MTWQWIVNQVFAFIGLIFVIILYQQKDLKKMVILRNFATLFVFIGLCFLGNVSAILFCIVGLIRNLITLYYAYKPNYNKELKYISSVLLILLLIVLNIIYWNNFMNLFSIILGSLSVITFMQTKPSTVRKMSVILKILSIIYYTLLLSPTNIVIEIIGVTSAIVGIIRLDRKESEINQR